MEPSSLLKSLIPTGFEEDVAILKKTIFFNQNLKGKAEKLAVPSRDL